MVAVLCQRVGLLDHFSKHLAEKYRQDAEALPLHAITPAMVRSFVCRPSVRRATQKTLYVALRAFSRWALEHGLLEKNPTDEVTSPKTPDVPASYLTMNEFQMVVLLIEADYARWGPARQATGQVIWLRHFITLAVYTGMRRGEIIALRWGDVRLPTPESPQGWVTIFSLPGGNGGILSKSTLIESSVTSPGRT